MESACATVDMASLQRSLPEEASGIEATVNADNLVLGPYLYPSSLGCENSMDLALHGCEASRKVVFKLKGIECCACASSIEKKNTIQKAIQDSGFDVTAVEEEPEWQSITCRLRVKGMTCTACSSSLESQLKQIEGVKKAVVALAIEEAEVQYDPALVNYKQIIKVIADTGFEAELISAGNESSRIHLRLENSMIYSKENMELMQCSLMELAGVKAVEIDARERRIIISYDPSVTGPRCFIDTINNAGFKASVHADLSGTDRSKDVKDYKHHFLWSCAFTIPIFLFAMVFMYIPILKDTLEKKVVNALTVGMLVRWALSTPVQFGFGRRFYRGAYNALRHGSANMDVLIALGTNAAYFYSVYAVLRATTSSKGFKESDFFETSAMLISFILLGKYLEALAKGKTSEAISKLIELQPECATLLIRDHNGEILSEEVISSQLIQKKDVLKIVPGKKVPTDGVVVWGQSHVNESMITGEARPVPKHPGDKIIGGTVNESGVLHVQATRVGSETALSQIVRLVKAAQMAKAPVQKYADRISEYFVPFVVLSAVVTWLAWFGAGICGSYPKSWIPTYMDEFELALQFGISVLVIACPCALGLATPTAVMVATGKGASQGILIKSGQALESTHKVPIW